MERLDRLLGAFCRRGWPGGFRISKVKSTGSSRSPDSIGKSHRNSRCRLCRSEKLTKILDLGNMPLAGGFLERGKMSSEKLYPLALYLCANCSLVQLIDVVPPETLFKNYFYFSSAIDTLVHHFRRYAEELTRKFQLDSHSVVVEIGSNDGILLKPLQALGVKCIGVDPASNVTRTAAVEGLETINDFFSEDVSMRILEKTGPADLILASNSFAHIDDMEEVMRGVTTLLKRDGVLAIEVHYLPVLIKDLNYEMIYHEHLNYYSVSSLSRFFDRYNMEIFEVKKTPIHGGSVRCYVRRKGVSKRAVSESVNEFLDSEERLRLDDYKTYSRFAKRVQNSKKELLELLQRLKKRGICIIGYGASGRATILMNFCRIDSELIDYVVDDSPVKQGFFTPGTHLPIKAWPSDETEWPDYVLLFAWSFLDEIKKKRFDYLREGGKFVVPLPKVRVVSVQSSKRPVGWVN